MQHRNVVRRGLEKTVAAAALPPLRWHDLRHVAASALIERRHARCLRVAAASAFVAAITLSIYAHEFERAAHHDRTREIMEGMFEEVLG